MKWIVTAPVIRLKVALPLFAAIETITVPEVSPMIGHATSSIVRVFLAVSTAIEMEDFSSL